MAIHMEHQTHITLSRQLKLIIYIVKLLSLSCSHKLLNLRNQLNRVNLAKASEYSICCVSTHANNPDYASEY